MRLARSARIALPTDDILGPSTLNIGTIGGGRAPNVIPDQAQAEIMIRLVGDSTGTQAGRCRRPSTAWPKLREVLEIPALHLGSLDGETTVVAYTTDIPAFGSTWGKPFLFGPGTIHVAHTLEERVPKRQLLEAVEIYQQMVRQLMEGR